MQTSFYSHIRNRYSGSGKGGSLYAYRAGEAFDDPATGRTIKDYRDKTEVEHVELILPDTIAPEVRQAFLDNPPLLFSVADVFENEKARRSLGKAERVPYGPAGLLTRALLDAHGNPVLTQASMLAIEERIENTRRWTDDIIALAMQLPLDSHIEAGRDFARMLAMKGEIGMFAVHNKSLDPHIHFLRSDRAFVGGDFSNKHLHCSKNPLQMIDLILSRQESAEIINRQLARSGYDLRVDHRDFSDQGIHFVPTRHEGPGFHARGVGLAARENAKARITNERRLLRNPNLIIAEVGAIRISFTAADIREALVGRVPSADSDWLTRSSIMAVKSLDAVPDGTRQGVPHFITKDTDMARKGLVSALSSLANNNAGSIIVMAPCATRFPVFAGDGDKVGFAPTLAAAADLSIETGRPVLSFAQAAPRYRRRRTEAAATDGIAKGASLIIDEADCADITTMGRLARLALDREGQLSIIATPGALKSIDAGLSCRIAAEHFPVIDMTKKVSPDLSRMAEYSMTDNPAFIGDLYRHTEFAPSFGAVFDTAFSRIKAFDAGDTRAMVVSDPKIADHLNREIRGRLQADGTIGTDVAAVARHGGSLLVAERDRIIFTANMPRALIRNGATGTVLSVAGGQGVTVRLDEGRTLTLPQEPVSIEHAWALSRHRAKDAVIDRSVVLLTDGEMDRQSIGRILTGAVKSVDFVADASIIPTIEKACEVVARDGSREKSPATVALLERDRNSVAVSEYLELEKEIAARRRDIYSRVDDPRQDPEWRAMRDLEIRREAVAKDIVSRGHECRAAAGTAWGRIQTHSGMPMSQKTMGMDVMASEHPIDMLRQVRRRAEMSDLGIDADTIRIAERLGEVASQRKAAYADIRRESGDKPSRLHKDWAECERKGAVRDRLAAMAVEDPAAFRPLMTEQGIRWRDISRWADRHKKTQHLERATERLPADGAKTKEWLELRSDESFERKRGHAAPVIQEKKEAAALSPSSPMMLDAAKIGFDGNAMRRDAANHIHRAMVDGYRKAKAEGRDEALVFAFQLATKDGDKKLDFEKHPQILKDATEFERRLPISERNAMAMYGEKGVFLEREKTDMAEKWAKDPVAMSWLKSKDEKTAADVFERTTGKQDKAIDKQDKADTANKDSKPEKQSSDFERSRDMERGR